MNSDTLAQKPSYFNDKDGLVVPVFYVKQLETQLQKALQTIKSLEEQYTAAKIILSDFDPNNIS
jgi:hypothetical protein